MSFRPPTDYYCEALIPIDEQICALLAQRKELSESNPGFPDLDRIAAWCKEYNLNEDLIHSIFGSLYNERHFRPRVVPTGFIQFVPILKSVVKDGIVYAVTHMKQYENASVVYVEAEVDTGEPYVRFEHAQFELSISPEYECRLESGHGQPKGMQHSFVVIPALPDDVTQLDFMLTIKPIREVPEIRAVAYPDLTVNIK